MMTASGASGSHWRAAQGRRPAPPSGDAPMAAGPKVPGRTGRKISVQLTARVVLRRPMRIYFMGVCGTAMGNAALLARAAGHEVLGADSGVYPPMSTVLAQAGIT